MKLMKGLLSAFAVVLATTACAGNSGENKKSNESTKEDNKMEVVALNKADFLKKVYNYEANPNDWKFEGSRPAIVDFYATWCGPCKMLAPAVERMAEVHPEVHFYKVDIDEEMDLASRFQVMSVPTLIYFKNGQEVNKTVGLISPAELEAALEKAK